MADIFICYRRDDTESFSGRIFDRLTQHFGNSAAFLDVEGRKPGEFLKLLEEEANSCKVMLVLIGKKWLTLTNAAGRRRLDEEDDVVRQECRIGLNKDAVMIPVLIEGVPMPSAEEFPSDIARLADFEAAEITHKRFRAGVSELIGMIEEKVPRAGSAQESNNLSSHGTSAPVPASLAADLPGRWQISIIYPNGMNGESITQFAPNGTFQSEGRSPLGTFRIDGTWRLDGPQQITLLGQASAMFQILPYMATAWFSHISKQNMVARMSSGEQTTWQRLS